MDFSGRVEVIYGPMWGGKTTELLRRIRRYLAADKKCLILKHSDENRYSSKEVTTHDEQSLPSAQASTIREGIKANPDADVIGIDEGQFFPDLVEMCDELANKGKVVIVAALDGNYQRKTWKTTIGLISIAEEITKLNAVCMKCFVDSPFTRRITTETDEVVIGGKEKYTTVCRSCYFN